jgi:hypothetical protein
MDEHMAEHVLEDALWSLVRKRQPLDKRHRDHIRDCRDCREFIEEVIREAEGQGFTLDESFQVTLNAR